MTHSGARVSADQAAFVLETVRAWLAHLGSSADVALALQRLKDYVEATSPTITDGLAAEALVRDYFTGTSPAIAAERGPRGRKRPDLILAFGDQTVVIEVKVASGSAADLEGWIEGAVAQAAEYADAAGISRAAAIIFTRTGPPEAFRTVRVTERGVSVVVIHALE